MLYSCTHMATVDVNKISIDCKQKHNQHQHNLSKVWRVMRERKDTEVAEQYLMFLEQIAHTDNVLAVVLGTQL